MQAGPGAAYTSFWMTTLFERRWAWTLIFVLAAAQASLLAAAPLPCGPSADATAEASRSDSASLPVLVVPVDHPLPPIRQYSTPAIPPRRIGVSLIPERIFSKYFSYRESLSAP